MTIKEFYEIFLQYPKITTDTRVDVTDSVFFALKGGNFNGNKYAEQALVNGAKYAIIDERDYKKTDQYILVEDVLSAMQDLANYHRKQIGIPILAITGTNGKTTTKEIVSRVLSEKYNLISTKGNLNNHIGVPLTLLSISQETEFAVIEMGANHPFEIEELCKIADPDFGLITNVGKAHIEGFGSVETILKTKAELYDHIRKKKGKVFTNIDNQRLLSKLDGVSMSGYSTSKMAAINAEIIRNNPFLEIEVNVLGKTFRLKTNIIGAYNLENILAAIAVGHHFGVDNDKIKSAIESYKPDNLRSQFIETHKNKIILDAYNANPTSMRAALTNFVNIESREKTVILGDMLELGKDSIKEHKDLIRIIERKNFDNVILIGKNFMQANRNKSFNCFADVESLIDFVTTNTLSDNYILVKGSRGIRLENVVEYL